MIFQFHVGTIFFFLIKNMSDHLKKYQVIIPLVTLVTPLTAVSKRTNTT